MRKTMKISGIYSITNTINGKRYYGSSVNVEGRRRQHFSDLRNGRHKNPHLQAAWDLYGELSFVFALVKEVASENLVVVEQTYLDSNMDGYNVSKCAECAPRGLKWTPEAKKRIGDARKGRRLSEIHKKSLSLANTGRRMTDAQRVAVSNRMRGILLDKETKEKISTKVKSLWEDEGYRERILAAQAIGKETDEAKKNYSAASIARWSNSEFAEKMSASRKKMWSDPEFRQKMIEVRKIQGLRLRERNSIKKEEQSAL